MADLQVVAFIKDLGLVIQTCKAIERESIFNQLNNITLSGLPEQVVKIVCKALLLTLPRYNDSKSKRLVDQYVKTLAQHQPVASRHLLKYLSDLSKEYSNISPTKSTAQICLTALGWSVHIAVPLLNGSVQCTPDELKQLIQTHAYFLTVIEGARHARLRNKAYRKIAVLWKQDPVVIEEYLKLITDLEPSFFTIVLWGYVVKCLALSKAIENIGKCKAIFLDLFTKLILGSKTKPSIYILESSHALLRHITHDDFRDVVLPAIQKALLRNPEVILQGVNHVIRGVSLDLSQYALSIGKCLGTHLHSKEDLCREEAIEACQSLAQQCSSTQAVNDLLTHYFEILNGSEGKLTVITQRLGVLSGIGNLSFHTVSGNSSVQQLSDMVAEHVIGIMRQEVHEGTLIHALKMLSLWCSKFTLKVPSFLMQWFQTGPGLKTSTSAVRNAYFQCMNCAFQGNTLHQAKELIPMLLKTVNKAISQPSQIPLVTEGLTAACILLRLYNMDLEAENKLKSLVTTLAEPDKHPFLSEKFLTSANEDALQYVMLLIERLVLDHIQMLSTNMKPVNWAILYILTWPSMKLRRYAEVTARKLFSVLGGTELAASLLKDFSSFVEQMKSEVSFGGDKENDEGELAKGINPQILVNCLICLCSGNNLDISDSITLGQEALLPAHLPVIVGVHPHLWSKLVVKIHLSPSLFAHSSSEKLSAIITSGNLNLATENALQTLVKIAPETYVPVIVAHIIELLSDPSLIYITEEEYKIFLTPEGCLYDSSVIENLKESTNNTKNIKRESKLYSYKEQMEELELRKELEEKKRAKGLVKEPTLTKKQLEAKKFQLDKEAATRNKIKELDSQIKQAAALLTATLKGNPNSVACHVKELVQVLLSLLSSPLCARVASEMFVELHCAISTGSFAKCDLPVAYATLRLLKPNCELDPSWIEVNLNAVLNKIISNLYNRTCKPTGQDYDELESAAILEQRLSAPAFAYCFPLLHHILLKSNTENNVILQVLHIISEHAQLRESGDKEKIPDLRSPKYLPRKQMMQALIEMIRKSSGHIQNIARDALVNVCKSGSGEKGCSIASIEEIHVLLSALQAAESPVRQAALDGLNEVILALPSPGNDYTNGMYILQRLWGARFDSVEEIRESADRLFNDMGLQIDPSLSFLLLSDVIHPEITVRHAAADALAAVLKEYPENVYSTMEQALECYHKKLVVLPPVLDSLGRIVSDAPPDNWEPRSGIAVALGKMAPFLTQDMVTELMSFFVPQGLGDRHSEVRKHMLDAAVAIVDRHGKEFLTTLLPVFQEFLDDAPDDSSYDAVRQSVVILMGTLARHLDKQDPRLKPIVSKLIEALSTPSQQVQEAVASCLPHLVPGIKDEAPTLVRTLVQLLLESEVYGERKGAAYGLAGLVKGLGILSLKQLDIMNTLTTAIQNKKNNRHREGALFAFEMLCNMLGRLFEPYIVHVLPHLLLCFGDGNQYVREATDDTAKAVMSKLSAHGVKLVLPSLLAALEEDSWRTKAGSVELLGAMAFCAPKQLSSCLPSIVPKLIEVLSDSHMKVQNAGAQALKLIGSVIRNPEIQAIVPVLLDALQDPSKKTSPCLATLLDTKFVHFIDAPSLALIMPVVQRAFQDRSTETRKMAAQIIGNMYSLTDQKDLSPYLPTIIPGLKQSLLDPVPEVRSVSARALGAMVKGMGESSFEDLLPWLMQTLTSESSSVDRSGAAQGLSEVMGGLGVDKLNKLMPEIISTAERMDIAPHVKDGYIMMFIYLPMVFNKEFTPYIGQIINPILKALADENEFVRDTALRAGQRIVNMYADTAITLLLPELEKGLFDDNWRIRYSSVQLLGDLLYKISGVSGKMSTETADEDDNFGTEQSHKAILLSLGKDRRNRVLAGLYMGRSDVALMVRQAALHVWKVVVTNTPRTLREILPTLFSLLLGCLASNSYDKRQVAARTLGDLVHKLGERVLPEIIPILEKGLDSQRADQRQGVCIGLSEIMASTSREMVLTFVDSLVPTVRRALCDPLPEVRQAAAKTFDSLHSTVGVRALDDILPPLLQHLGDPQHSENTLDGLRQVMAIKSKVVLPYLVPQLTAPPVNTKALSFLSAVAGEALTKHLAKILPALLSALSSAHDTPTEQQELEYCQAVVLSVTDDLGVRTVIDHLLEAARSDDVSQRRAAVALLCGFCCQTRADFTSHVPQLLRGIIHLFTDSNHQVLQLSWEALNAVTKTLDSTGQQNCVADVRQAVRFASYDLKGQELLPGFCLEKGITPILPIFREAILNGVPELKEQAAQGLGEVIKLTSPEGLKSSVLHITGPLIRILGDRFNWNIKIAFLETLALLLAKVGVMLKSFLPQLQTTFLRALSDSHRLVRLRAATALGHLIVVHTRCDPLFTELHNAVKNAEDPSLRETTLHALRCVIGPAGDKMSDNIRRNVLVTVSGMLSLPDDTCRMVAGGCLGSLCQWLPECELVSVVREHLLDDDSSQDWMLRHGRSVALKIALKEAPDKIVTPEWNDRIIKTLTAYLIADRLPIALSGVQGTGYFICHKLKLSENIPQVLLVTFSKSMNHQTNEVKQAVALTANYIARSVQKPLSPPVMKTLIPHLVNGTKEKNTVVKANSEYALVAVLQMRTGDNVAQQCISLLEVGARDSLQDVMTKVLRRVASQPEPKEEEFDDTLLT